MPTKIEWTEETWNPVIGCTPISLGCGRCYAARMAGRLSAMGQARYRDLTVEGRWTGKVRAVNSELFRPLRWRKPRRVFVCSMGDLFHPDVDFDRILRIFEVMQTTPSHTYQVLTKRPGRMAEFCAHYGIGDDNDWPRNVWAGASASTQADLERVVPELLATPAAVRFLSLEPLLERVDLRVRDDELGARWDALECGIGWVIIGCESGPRRRPCELDWVRSVVEQCKAAGVACFVKQLDLDGRVSKDPAEWPEDLRIRQLPDAAANPATK